MKRIAFHAPLKPVDHPTPSGDRLMARQLFSLLERTGHEVEVASALRVYQRDAQDVDTARALREQAAAERERLRVLWQQHGAPDLWFCYHPYVKSPDLIGPPLCREFSLDYVTAEASWSPRRNHGVWQQHQADVLQAVNLAAVNLCLTRRDRQGLARAAPAARLAALPPFIDATPFSAPSRADRLPLRLITVAMMREGDKRRSYHHLVSVLAQLTHLPWQISVVGDGDCAAEIRQWFAQLPAERVLWHGRLATPAIAQLMREAALFVWPGCGEAYGLAYLEAQAAGVPVVAWDTAGVADVVRDGVGGCLLPDGNEAAMAAALAALIQDPDRRAQLSIGAREQVARQHDLPSAAARLQQILSTHCSSCRQTGQRSGS